MKRITAILILLLANTALLAHAVIPHSHHSTVAACSSGDCCEHNADNILHLSINESHHGCEDNGHECCVLERTDVVAPNTQKHTCCSGACSTHEHGNELHLQAVLFENQGIEPPRVLSYSFRQEPFILSIYTSLAGCSIGLRAPPFYS